MADGKERAKIHEMEKEFTKFLEEGRLRPAFHVFDKLINGDFYEYPTYFQNITGASLVSLPPLAFTCYVRLFQLLQHCESGISAEPLSRVVEHRRH